ncbi:hypothetical protein UCDDS831_g06655 [Diplodia seriata]|uniref:Uncharacterized protein n=1 Tax=Diplodia seriata TaxID=420778 RepID=A0A0G2E1J9_9PEZI|nr:hypothetical protein UCDDS831_g06655 [Diplodia seriata]
MQSSTSSTTVKKSPAFARKLAHLRLSIAPIYPLPDGPPHVDFPATMLQFHLLTEAQLDALARYYSQSAPDEWTGQYPAAMGWDADFLADPALADADRVRIKLRKFGRFVGLRGCDTPVDETVARLRLAEARLEREIELQKDAERARDKLWRRWHGV